LSTESDERPSEFLQYLSAHPADSVVPAGHPPSAWPYAASSIVDRIAPSGFAQSDRSIGKSAVKHETIQTMTSHQKGANGEQKVVAALSQLDSSGYRSFHDLVIDTRGGTTQIDHVVASKFGIFVLETKRYSGTIFAGADDPYWHQVFGRRRIPFQSPIHQNARHIRALSRNLDLPVELFISIVVFVRADWGWPPPPGVMGLPGLLTFILRFRKPLISSPSLESAISMLDRLRTAGLTLIDHLHSLRLRLLWERVLLRYGVGPKLSRHLSPDSRRALSRAPPIESSIDHA
jgi:hypothetical protein